MRPRLYFAWLLCVLCPAARADYLEVRRPAAVYAQPSRTSEVVSNARIGAQLALLDADTQSGYYHVDLGPTGQTGWIYRSLVRRHSGSVPGPTTGGGSPSSGGIPAAGAFPATKCALPYNEQPGSVTAFDQSCGLTGTAANGSGEFPQNIVKNDLCERAAAQPVTIPDLQKLQKIVDDAGIKYGSSHAGKSGPPTDRSPLNNLPALSTGLKLEEGDVVSYVGFLAEAHYMPQSEAPPKTGKGGETVNCNSTAHAQADIHLALSDAKGPITANDPNRIQKLCGTISAEMIPHLRPGIWNMDALTQVMGLQRPVRVTGHLFFDGSHEPGRNGTPVGSDPRRIAEWEIHPIYTFEVCTQDAVNKCDPDKPSLWQPLSKATGVSLMEEIDE
jgi:hypothetical protein